MVIEAWLLAFFKLLFFLFYRLIIFVILYHFFQEGVLGAFVGPREPIEDVAPITAVILTQFELEYFIEEFVRYSNLVIGDLNFRPAVLWLFQIGTLLIDFLFHCCLDFLELRAAIIGQLVLTSSLFIDCSHTEHFINELFDVNSWNVIVFGQLLSIECLSAGRWTSDKDLDWVESAVRVEFTLERANVLSDAELCMPRELLLLSQFVLLVLIFDLLLLRCQGHCLESI